MATEAFEMIQKELCKLIEGDDGKVGKAMKQLEEATGSKREEIFKVVQVALAIYLVFGQDAQLMCNMIAFAYPAYASIMAIESHCKEDDTQWLTYWTVFALFSLVDYVGDHIMGFFPLYWLLKCVFMLWLYLPFTRGAQTMYEKHVHQLYCKYLIFDADGQTLASQGTQQQSQASAPAEETPAAPSLAPTQKSEEEQSDES